MEYPLIPERAFQKSQQQQTLSDINYETTRELQMSRTQTLASSTFCHESRVRDVFSLVVSSEDTEVCQILSFISMWADTIRQMLYYEISSDWLGLQSFPESWESKVIKNSYYSSDGAPKKVQARGETRRSGRARASAPRSLLR